MKFSRLSPRNILLALISLFTLGVVTACGGSATPPTNNNPAFDVTPTPTPIPYTTYADATTFTIDYPTNWVTQDPNTNSTGLDVTSPDQSLNLAVESQTDPSLTVQALIDSELAQNANGFDNFTSEEPTQVTVAGQEWTLIAWKAQTKGDGLQFDAHLLVTEYNDVFYQLKYWTVDADFAQADTEYFQVMKDSFTFK